jgi:methylthioribose-1-phosphate isomerase
MVPTVEWKDGAVRLLDQSRLPGAVEFLHCRDYREVAAAIRELKVRGAPAIGVTAAMGVALGAQAVTTADGLAFTESVRAICGELAATRPTAVNLFWAIERMKRKLEESQALPIAESGSCSPNLKRYSRKTSRCVRPWDGTERNSSKTARRC